MTRASRNPLVPDRDGVSPSCVALPAGQWRLMLDFLSERFTFLSRDAWAQRMASGWVWNDDAQAVAADAPFQAHTRLYYWRHQAGETEWPTPVHVVYQDEHLVVADKPHYMPVTPSGPHVQRSLLVHLKRRLQLPELTPIHRIDRDTAGLVMFAVQAKSRAAYQGLFRDRQIAKRYEAVAPWVDLDALATSTLPGQHAALSPPHFHGLGQWSALPELALSHCAPTQDPRQEHAHTPRHALPSASQAWCYRSHLAEDADFFTMHEAAGEANCETHIQCLARAPFASSDSADPTWALYALSPHTGRRHQLRAHLSAIGIPMRHDPYYPRVTRGADDPDDTARPLQLLARALAFDDPITGETRCFVSQQHLMWPVRPHTT